KANPRAGRGCTAGTGGRAPPAAAVASPAGSRWGTGARPRRPAGPAGTALAWAQGTVRARTRRPRPPLRTRARRPGSPRARDAGASMRMTPAMPGWFRWLLVPLAAVGATAAAGCRSSRSRSRGCARPGRRWRGRRGAGFDDQHRVTERGAVDLPARGVVADRRHVRAAPEPLAADDGLG